MFRVGQKCVCVEECRYGPISLIKGNIYTVAKVGMFGRQLHIDVAEALGVVPLAWRITRFRPIVKRKTDISVFRAMLTPTSKEPSHVG